MIGVFNLRIVTDAMDIHIMQTLKNPEIIDIVEITPWAIQNIFSHLF